MFSNTIHALDHEIIDLTHAQNEDAIHWPTLPQYNFTILQRGFTDDLTGEKLWLEYNSFEMAEHSGTHMDAPCHFAQGALKVHEIPLKKLAGPGVIINVKSKVENNNNYRVAVSDIQDWENKYNKIPDGAVVFMNAGWSRNIPTRHLYSGVRTIKIPLRSYPGWHEDTVDWLLKNRNIHVIGGDTPSFDYGQTTTFPVHQLLGEYNIPGMENVANLDSIPESGSIIYVAAFKIYDGSGSPSRVFATVSGATNNWSSKCLIILMGIFYCLY
ncbi:LOW QUALITY PROTEIN: isatin hydrolase-like [Amphiura filiformis]|uniref:LOW QUALITY PROTEIN: isatin hydrolase-like n=1 Tax=Amphiura filiformis TaxID=82378 RepID=UPI003B215943